MKILKFGEEDCPGCKIMKPLFEEIETENPTLQTEYHEVEKSADLVKKYNIEHVPTFVFIDKDGNELTRMIDVHEREKVMENIEKYKDR